ncbi:MAG: hypothetical protein ABSF95_18725 [Verrucomicrobiota bacterium]|jgi:hypothetical protein
MNRSEEEEEWERWGIKDEQLRKAEKAVAMWRYWALVLGGALLFVALKLNRCTHGWGR